MFSLVHPKCFHLHIVHLCHPSPLYGSYEVFCHLLVSLITPFSFFIVFWAIHYLISPKVHVFFCIRSISDYYIGGAFVDLKDCATIHVGTYIHSPKQEVTFGCAITHRGGCIHYCCNHIGGGCHCHCLTTQSNRAIEFEMVRAWVVLNLLKVYNNFFFSSTFFTNEPANSSTSSCINSTSSSSFII